MVSEIQSFRNDEVALFLLRLVFEGFAVNEDVGRETAVLENKNSDKGTAGVFFRASRPVYGFGF